MNHAMRQSEKKVKRTGQWSLSHGPKNRRLSLECQNQVDGGAVLIRALCLSPELLYRVMIAGHERDMNRHPL